MTCTIENGIFVVDGFKGDNENKSKIISEIDRITFLYFPYNFIEKAII
jgi:hypothetical protein